ncbi:MAG TPA: efflux RND transporter periplasmic adaptor subunit [Lacipirellulaceae bacterium]|nr:efflux RND transporter periplasmic adaptor subunit [Lacipirellulaceae bacterium]
MRRDLKLLGIVAVAGLAGCGPSNAFVPPPPPQVTVAHPVQRDVADALQFTGWTQATAAVDLRSRVNGYLERIEFEDGAMVEKGQLLFVIEQAPFQTALAAAEAELLKAEASRQLEQSEYDRTVPLVQRQAVTQSDLDVALAELATARANVASAEAAVRKAKLDLSYTEVRAPISGQIGLHLVDVGNLVQAEQTLLAKIESFDPIYAYFSVSESDLLRYMEYGRENGLSLEGLKENPPRLYLGLANEEGFSREGHFDFTERSIDRQTGTALRRGVFANENRELIPGLFVRINAPLGEPRPRLLVEERAVGTDQQGDYLLVVNSKNVVEHRPVKLGAPTEGMRVVQSGVSAEDWVVVNGLQRARPGTPVDPQKADAERAPEAVAAK